MTIATIPTLLAQALASATAAAAAAAKAVPAAGATLSPAVLKGLQGFQFNHRTPLETNAPWLTHAFAGFFIVFAVALVLLLAVQTTKQEGLSGTIGGRVEAAYRPRLGFDQQLQRLTSFVAIGFVFFAVVVSLSGI